MQNYVQVTDSSYTVSELKNMEGKILLALKFNLNYTTSLQILESVAERWPKDHNNKLSLTQQKTMSMCKYLIELSLFDNIAKEYCMKTIVVSSMMLSDSVLKVKTECKGLEEVSKEQMTRCFRDMCLCLQNVSKSGLKLKAIKKKYCSEKYHNVGKFRI